MMSFVVTLLKPSKCPHPLSAAVRPRCRGTELEPRADPRERMDGKEDLFVYVCALEAGAKALLAWREGYRDRWGIETGYRELEHNRLRSTTEYRSNQVFLS